VQFNVLEIADRLKIQLVNRAGDEYIFICPFCSGKKEYPKLYINQSKGVFICHHCHLEGSITDLWALRCGVDTKTAYKQMVNSVSVDIQPIEPIPTPIRDTERIHLVYSEFFKMLTLNPAHKQDLERRGLTPDYLSQFKSLPEDAKTRWNICSILNKKYGLDDVPGFQQKISRKNKSYWDCHRSGMLIPVRDVHQQLTGFQVRTNREPKYIWFSYSGQLKSSVHVIPGRGIPWIIEGVLKSYITHHFLQIPCFGIPGTDTWRLIPFHLIRGGKVVVAYDIEQNPYTLKSRDNLVAHLENMGIEPIIAGWNKNLGKGIDDACLTIYKQGIMPRPEMFLPGIAA
jgi:hypothetical protein